MIKEDIKTISSTKKDLRDFGLAVGTVLFLIGCILLWRHWGSPLYFILPGAAMIVAGLFAPWVLKPFQRPWMIAATVLGWFSTRLILIIIYYGVLTPTKFIARLFGVHFLDLKLDRSAKSYWLYRPSQEKKPSSSEKQF